MWGNPTHSIYEEPIVISERLDCVPSIQNRMSIYMLHWLIKFHGWYSPTIVREFYVSYVSTIHNTLHKRKKPLARPRLSKMSVRGQQVDIISYVLFGPGFPAPISTIGFDYRIGQTRNPLVMRYLELWASLMRWVAGYFAERVSKPSWVAIYLEPIVKALLNSPIMFW